MKYSIVYIAYKVENKMIYVIKPLLLLHIEVIEVSLKHIYLFGILFCILCSDLFSFKYIANFRISYK